MDLYGKWHVNEQLDPGKHVEMILVNITHTHTPRVDHGLVGIGTIQNGEVQYSGDGISNLLNGETSRWGVYGWGSLGLHWDSSVDSPEK